MSEDSGIQVPPEDNCEALFGTHISANIMLALVSKKIGFESCCG